MLAADLARCLDPRLWFTDAGIAEPDGWQVSALCSDSPRQIWNVHRQGGKTTTAALKAIRKASEAPDAPVLVISPSQRQSAELVRACVGLHSRINGLPPVTSESVHRLEFANRSRIISLPSSEGTIRGYSRVSLLIFDEASRIPDETVSACRPMLAVSGGSIVMLSTPAGRRGVFFETWTSGGDVWERTEVTVDNCPRISPEFLDEERKALGEALYAQEYLCRFVENDEAVFSTALIDRAFSTEVLPLWA